MQPHCSKVAKKKGLHIRMWEIFKALVGKIATEGFLHLLMLMLLMYTNRHSSTIPSILGMNLYNLVIKLIFL